MEKKVQQINIQPLSKSNRYLLKFHKETNVQLKEMREEACKSLNYVSEAQLEVDDKFFDGYTIPTRPKWTYLMSKEQVDLNEKRYFFVSKFEFYNPQHSARSVKFSNIL